MHDFVHWQRGQERKLNQIIRDNDRSYRKGIRSKLREDIQKKKEFLKYQPF